MSDHLICQVCSVPSQEIIDLTKYEAGLWFFCCLHAKDFRQYIEEHKDREIIMEEFINDAKQKIRKNHDKCGTCKYWDFKSSGTRSWGRCLNEKVADSIRLDILPPDDMIFLSTDDRGKFLREMRENTEPRFDGDIFGCIYHVKSL